MTPVAALSSRAMQGRSSSRLYRLLVRTVVFVALVLLVSRALWSESFVEHGSTAVATLVTTDAYIVGAEGLARSIKRAHKDDMPFRLVCMVVSDVSEAGRDRLMAAGWQVSVVNPIANPSSLNERFRDTFTKLNVFRLTRFSRVLFMDADTIVLKPLVSLFHVPPLAAVPDCCGYFNSGVMLLRPSESEFAAMVDAIPTLPTYDGGDQGFLNSYFRQWTRLDYRWNAQLPDFLDLPSAWQLDNIAVIHFEKYKPWLAKSITDRNLAATLEPLFQIWRNVTG
jgi:hypothetical protein